MEFHKNKNYQILTPNGFEDFYGIQKIKKNHYFELSYSIDDVIFSLKASDNHKIKTKENGFVTVDWLSKNDIILTQNGEGVVVNNQEFFEEIELYDVIDAGIDKCYYTNKALSHNCEFIGSTHTLIAPSKLRTMTFQNPISAQSGLDVYEEPKKHDTYCLIADTAQGKEQDYSAFSIFNVSEIPYRQVAKYRDNKISPMIYPNIIYNVASKFNSAWVMIEVNDVGQSVAETLYHEMEYENMLMVSMHGRAGQKIGGGFGKNTQLGIRTSKQLKRIGCSTLKDMIETDKLFIPDFDTIAELTTFVSKNNTYMAEEGSHDDLAMTLVIFSWLVQQQYFKDLTNLDIRKQIYQDQIEALESDMLPFGIIDDGSVDTTFQDSSGQVWHTTEDNEFSIPY